MDSKAALCHNLTSQYSTPISSHHFSSTDIPLREEFIIKDHHGYEWQIDWTVIQDEIGKDTDRGGKEILEWLYMINLEGLSVDQRLSWNGKLEPRFQELSKAFWPLLDYKKLAFKQNQALVSSYSANEYNIKVLNQALLMLADDVDLTLIGGAEDMIFHYAKVLHSIPLPLIENDVLLARQARNITSSFPKHQQYESLFLDRYVELCSKELKQYMGITNNNSLQDIKKHLHTVVLPRLSNLKKEYAEVGKDLSQALAKEVCLISLPTISTLLELDLHSKQKTDGVLTFNMFTGYKLLLSFDQSSSDLVHSTFKPCLPSWLDAVYNRAKEQVSKVLEHEKVRNSWDLIQEYDSPDLDDEDWLVNSSALEVGGIFKTCEITWKDLAWPELKTHLQFGAELLEKLDQVFQDYINSLFDIIMSDHVFDKDELVMILKTVVFSMGFLEGMFDTFNEELAKSNEQDEFEEVTQAFQMKISNANARSKSFAEQFILSFAEHHKSTLNRFRKVLFHPNDNNPCLLGHVSQLLIYFDKTLVLPDGFQTIKYTKMIHESIFDEVDSIFIQVYHEVNQQRRKTKEVMTFLRHYQVALFELEAFKDSVNLEMHEELANISSSLAVLFTNVSDAIARFLKHLSEDLQATPTNKSTGKLEFKPIIEDSQVTVKLKSISSLKIRPGKKHINPCVTVSLMPAEAGDNPILDKDSTLIYKDTDYVLFDWGKDDRERSSFTLRRPKQLKNEQCYLVMKLFDHSNSKVYKVMRGAVVMPLDKLIEVSSQSDWIQSEFLPLPPANYPDLRSRMNEDEQTRSFLAKYDKNVRGSKIPTTRTKSDMWITVTHD